jgi:hypothetical protein
VTIRAAHLSGAGVAAARVIGVIVIAGILIRSSS